MTRRRGPKIKVTINTRVKENPGVFRVDNGVLFCNFCDHSVDWVRKSTVDDHINSLTHKHKKNLYENRQRQHQQTTLTTSFASSESKKIIIHDLVEVFAIADIPLEKVNSMLSFFKKHCKEGGAIPQAATLRQLYVPRVFSSHLETLQNIFCQKPVSIIMDETTDACQRSVVNTLFVYRKNTKLVSVDFLTRVNNVTMGQTLISILPKYDIPITSPRLFLSDSAAYMKKCYREVLHPIMPQLIHIPCCAHILNLIGDTWRTFNHFSGVKKLLEKVKETFTRSPARRRRYIDHLRFHGINQPRKIPLPCKTRWNSWFEMVDYTKDHLVYWPEFFKAEIELDQTETLKTIVALLSTHFGLITIYVNFISFFSRQFVQTLNFFQQQEKPVFPFVENQLQNLSAYLENNIVATSFGSNLDSLIINYHFRTNDFYPIFQQAFNMAYEKFAAHIPSHPGRPLFRACQIFNPKFIQLGDITRKDIRQYNIITELDNPSNDLLDEWAIYCGSTIDMNLMEITLDEYWLNMAESLPLLSQIALDYIWLPISSCSVERSFSKYNSILDDNRQNLSEDSLRSLNMLYFNSSNLNM